MHLRSPAFANGSRIPTKYTGDGEDVSPPLEWDHVPSSTKEFALLCEDPDAPTPEPWIHWVLWGIPASDRSLPEGVSEAGGASGTVGKNSWKSGKTTGYRGPAPPPGHGVHHYHFRLFALDAPVQLSAGVDKHALMQALQGHVLAQAETIGTYERK